MKNLISPHFIDDIFGRHADYPVGDLPRKLDLHRIPSVDGVERERGSGIRGQPAFLDANADTQFIRATKRAYYVVSTQPPVRSACLRIGSAACDEICRGVSANPYAEPTRQFAAGVRTGEQCTTTGPETIRTLEAP